MNAPPPSFSASSLQAGWLTRERDKKKANYCRACVHGVRTDAKNEKKPADRKKIKLNSTQPLLGHQRRRRAWRRGCVYLSAPARSGRCACARALSLTRRHQVVYNPGPAAYQSPFGGGEESAASLFFSPRDLLSSSFYPQSDFNSCQITLPFPALLLIRSNDFIYSNPPSLQNELRFFRDHL